MHYLQRANIEVILFHMKINTSEQDFVVKKSSSVVLLTSFVLIARGQVFYLSHEQKNFLFSISV